MKSIILDTNIFVRFFAKDIPSQFNQSQQIIKDIEDGQSKGLISILVINELLWILERFYKIERSDFISKILNLLAYKNINIIEVKKVVIVKILKKMETTSIDFTDLYLIETAGDKKIVSFDKNLQKIA